MSGSGRGGSEEKEENDKNLVNTHCESQMNTATTLCFSQTPKTMPSIRLLTRSTIFKLQPFLSTIRLSSSTAEFRIKYQPGYPRSEETHGSFATAELSQRQPRHWKFMKTQREGWQLTDAFSEKGVLHHIHKLRKENRKEYEQWLGQEHARQQVLKGSESEIIERNCKLELLRHVDGIEKLLGYSFESYSELLTLLPRFPRGLRDYQTHALPKSTFYTMLGKLVLQLAMRDAYQWDSRKLFYPFYCLSKAPIIDVLLVDDDFLRTRGYAIGIYSFFVAQATHKPVKQADGGLTQLFNQFIKRERLRLSLIIPGIFGVLFRDGGMDAVKTVLKHTNFLGSRFLEPHRKAVGGQSLPHHIGLNVYHILFANSMWRFQTNESRFLLGSPLPHSLTMLQDKSVNVCNHDAA